MKKSIFTIVILLLLFNNIIYSQTQKTIKIDELTVNIPDENWTIKKTQEKKWEVTMFKEKISIIKVVGYSIIKIVKDSIQVNETSTTNKEISDSIFHSEYIKMENDSKEGNYEIMDTAISKKILFDKEYYLFYFKTLLHKKPRFEGENILYLYFPEDFNSRRVFYRFMVNEYVAEKSLFISNDLEIINPVLKSIKIELK